MTVQTDKGQIVAFPASGEYILRKANENRREGRLLQAVELMRRGLELNPDREDVWLDLAETLNEMGCYEQSNRVLYKLLSCRMYVPEAYYGLAANHSALMDQAKLCDISASPNKSGISFEVYLTDYYEPYVMVSGTGTRYDCLTFAHEFGHFVNDYASAGSGVGIDVLEFFSQGMEYLSLCHTGADGAFVDLKLADSLTVYVEQAAYAEFERRIYELPAQVVNGEKLLSVYEQVCRSYGFDSMEWDPRDMVTVPHFYGNPLYIISYVVSNDAAMQLYELELAAPGAGKAVYEQNLDTQQGWFLAFLEEAGLESPFQRVDEVKALMEARFGA
jgi:oligoendopeptidase F